MRKGLLIVISGFSGAGKGTLMNKLVSEHEEYALSISNTSRPPREGEVHGVHYFFRTAEEFEALIEQDEFIEYAKYVNNYYGTPKSFVLDQMEKGKDVLLEIEVQGALQIKEKFPDAVLIFVTPPSIDELRKRLIGRGTEDIETINKRIERAKEEVKDADEYDYIVINDDLDKAAEDFAAIVNAKHQESNRRMDLIEKIKNELGE